jgi:hypothetical protein
LEDRAREHMRIEQENAERRKGLEVEVGVLRERLGERERVMEEWRGRMTEMQRRLEENELLVGRIKSEH